MNLSGFGRRNPIELWRMLLYPLPLVLFLCVWQMATSNNPQQQFIFSSPTKVGTVLADLISTGELWSQAKVTICEALAGLILGTVGGAIIGLLSWCSRTVALVSRPYIAALSAIPVFALAPIVIVWFGIGMFSKIMLAFLSTVAVSIVQSYQGAMSVELRYLRLMQVVGATRWQTFRLVVVPSSLIWVVNGLKLNVGLALLGAFIGEFISAEQGLGFMIVKASGVYDMAVVLSGVLALAVIALALTGLVEMLERGLLKWQNVAADRNLV